MAPAALTALFLTMMASCSSPASHESAAAPRSATPAAIGNTSADTTTEATATPQAQSTPTGIFKFSVLPSANSPDAIMDHLTSRWQIKFVPAPVPGGTRNEGAAGDTTRKHRELIAVVALDMNRNLRDVICGGQGADVVLATDATLREFVYDCLAQTVTGSAWAPFKTWLDQNYLAGSKSYKTATFQASTRSASVGISVDVWGT